MRIGIDIDNVIANFDDVLLKAYLKQDKKFRNTGIINDKVYFRKGMFDWTKEEELTFYKKNIETWVRQLQPLEDSKEIIDQLKKEGHQIILISKRDTDDYAQPEEMTKEWLKRYDIYYDRLITRSNDKLQACIDNQIDIMIEDNCKICRQLVEGHIQTFCMVNRYTDKSIPNLEYVRNWKEIYQKIQDRNKQEEQEKFKVIIDTDTYNEIDDQFALCYLLSSPEKLDVQAITIAPYFHEGDLSVEEGQEKSYQEVEKICNFFRFPVKEKVYKGSTDFMKNGYKIESNAVKKMIEVAEKNEKTYILAIGAITNVAIAIKKAPQIIPKIEVIWLGGNSLFYEHNREFNFKQDIEAVKYVFQSKVKLTIMPTKNVASQLTTSIYEIEHYLKGKNTFYDYLCEHFYNDGYHGITPRRVIWDISVIAYMLHPEWFMVKEVSCPEVQKDGTYRLTQGKHTIKMIENLKPNDIYVDFFDRLMQVGKENKENELVE